MIFFCTLAMAQKIKNLANSFHNFVMVKRLLWGYSCSSYSQEMDISNELVISHPSKL